MMEKINYRKNPHSNNYIIDIALSVYMDFFHKWDNDLFNKRDIHPELANFLDICSDEIPLRNRFEISLNIKNEEKDEEKEKMIRESYRNYYSFINRSIKKKMKELMIKTLLLAIISVCFIFSAKLLGEILVITIWTQVFLEGLMIGGWAFQKKY